MKRILLPLFFLGFITSCDVGHDPYLKHEVELKKVADDCSGMLGSFSMNSNIIGERYVFQECLPANAGKENVIVKRSGDTVSIQFDKSKGATSLYDLTVDINTKPRYNWLTIGNNTFPIIPAAH